MICLNMIVKNEAHCIRRCLASVERKIHYYVICDTGSADYTKDLIAGLLMYKPGLVKDMAWRGFGPSRTDAVVTAQASLAPCSDNFLLFIDADETLEGDLPPPEILADYDVVQCRAIGPAGIWCYRNLLARASIPWVFTPITHETLMPADGRKVRELDWSGCHIVQHDDSARRNSGAKGPEDVRLLEAWLAEHPNDSRAWFYLARSYQMVNEPAKAFSAYARRCELRGGDPQEIAVSRLFMGKIQTTDGDQLANENYMAAYRADPFRAEALCGIASNCIEVRDFVGAEMAARQACALTDPPGRIFSEQAAYDWIRWDLLIQSLIGLGGHRLREAREIFRAHPMPASESDRYAIIAKHLGFAAE